MFKVGDIVVRDSYYGDIYFQISAIEGETAVLLGIFQRLLADAPLDDLILVCPESLKESFAERLFQ